MAKQKPLKLQQTKIRITYEGGASYHVKGVRFYQVVKSDDGKSSVFVYTHSGVDSHGNEFETTMRIPMAEITNIRIDRPNANPYTIQVFGGKVWSMCEFATIDEIEFAGWAD